MTFHLLMMNLIYIKLIFIQMWVFYLQLLQSSSTQSLLCVILSNDDAFSCTLIYLLYYL